MWSIEYYKTALGRQPVFEWQKGLDKGNESEIDVKIKKLGEYGLKLLNTNMLKVIAGADPDFYELRGGRRSQCRIAIYYDRRRSTFVLLYGWLKKRKRDKLNIERARHLLHSYLSAQGG